MQHELISQKQLTQNRQYYRQRDATYGFQFYVPDGFTGFQYEYCCGADGVWTVTD